MLNKKPAYTGEGANHILESPMRLRSGIFLIAAMAALAGCEDTLGVTPVATEPDIVSVKLQQAADKASQALDSIASIEQRRSPASPPIEDYSGAPPNLTQPVTIRWSGPIEQIGKALADRAGYRFRVKGYQPAAPVTVNVDVYQQPLIHVLRNVGLQAGKRADLAIDPKGGVVEVRYAASDSPRQSGLMAAPSSSQSSSAKKRFDEGS